MEETDRDSIAEIVAKDTWTIADSDALFALLANETNAPEKFKDAIALIERFIEIDTDNFRLSSLYYTLGVLYKDHTSDISRAVECFNQSLDLDSNRLEAFSAIEELVASIGDVEAQIANYVRMIDRLKDGDKPAVLYKLYLNLGKLYLTVLYDKDDAREAFAAEDFSSARQFAAQAQELHLTARGRELLLLARWAEEFGAKTDFRRARDVTGQ